MKLTSDYKKVFDSDTSSAKDLKALLEYGPLKSVKDKALGLYIRKFTPSV